MGSEITGLSVGIVDGRLVGESVGSRVGPVVGEVVGVPVGEGVGSRVGAGVGDFDGFCEGGYWQYDRVPHGLIPFQRAETEPTAVSEPAITDTYVPTVTRSEETDSTLLPELVSSPL